MTNLSAFLLITALVLSFIAFFRSTWPLLNIAVFLIALVLAVPHFAQLF